MTGEESFETLNAGEASFKSLQVVRELKDEMLEKNFQRVRDEIADLVQLRWITSSIHLNYGIWNYLSYKGFQ